MKRASRVRFLLKGAIEMTKEEKQRVDALRRRGEGYGAIVQTPGRKRKRFCSDACRNAWWNAHLSLVKRKAVRTVVCAGCGQPFEAYGRTPRKYCSHACYVAHRFGGHHE